MNYIPLTARSYDEDNNENNNNNNNRISNGGGNNVIQTYWCQLCLQNFTSVAAVWGHRAVLLAYFFQQLAFALGCCNTDDDEEEEDYEDYYYDDCDIDGDEDDEDEIDEPAYEPDGKCHCCEGCPMTVDDHVEPMEEDEKDDDEVDLELRLWFKQ